jgi:hypothetical protein
MELEKISNGSNNSLFLSCQMGLSDGAFFVIKHNPLPNGNHPISIPIFPMEVADTLELVLESGFQVTFSNDKFTHVFSLFTKQHKTWK